MRAMELRRSIANEQTTHWSYKRKKKEGKTQKQQEM
jgi:hypothetical protein